MTDLLDKLKAALSDRYTIERELGRGGMAIVYLAHDQKLNRPVALKVLRPELAASLGSDRFLREIEIAAKLTHPNILTLYDQERPVVGDENFRAHAASQAPSDRLEVRSRPGGGLGGGNYHLQPHVRTSPAHARL